MSVSITCYPEYLSIEVIGSPAVVRKLGLEELGFKWDEETKAWTRDFPAGTKGEVLTEVAKKVFEKVKGVEDVKAVSIYCDVRATISREIETWKRG